MQKIEVKHKQQKNHVNATNMAFNAKCNWKST